MNQAASTSTASTAHHESSVRALLTKMTLDEKIGQMVQSAPGGYADREEMLQAIRNGAVGSFLNILGATEINAIQRVAVEESRLGIPLIIGRDVIHGFKTIFPIPLGMAATWNPDIVREAMAISAKEAAAHGIHWTFAPMIDITWDPRWGRIAESCGEDPYLASRLAVAMVEGYQGANPAAPSSIAACAKHYVGYGMAEAGRDYNTTYIPEPLLRNVHLRPFKAAADAGCLTFMSAFNDLNGVPASGNRFTLRSILRDEWDYKGMVVSDWDSVTEMISHGYCANEKDAAEKALLAGVDMEMSSRSYIHHIKELLAEEKISNALIDECVSNILRVKYALGLFEAPYVDEGAAAKVTLTDAHRDHARTVARESMVVLKNKDALLPLSKKTNIAVVGPLADAARDQLGTWIFDGDARDAVTVKAALEKEPGIQFTYAAGLEYSRDKDREGFAEALEAAHNADVVLYVGGEEASLSGEGNSRGIIDLPGLQPELIAALAETGKPLVLVIMAGRPLGIGAEIDHAHAVLYAWHPGTMAGPALVDLLFGDFSPSGKLPVTMVKGAGQIPLYYYRNNTGRPAHLDKMIYIDDIPRDSTQLSLGFRSQHIDYGATPLFPFGYGLSYTTFEYDAVQLSSDTISRDESLTVRCRVTNTGARAATEVVQLYVRDLVGSITRPIRELKNFQRVTLAPGVSHTVTFTLNPDELEFFNGEAYVIEPGTFHVWVAPHSDAGTHAAFELT